MNTFAVLEDGTAWYAGSWSTFQEAAQAAAGLAKEGGRWVVVEFGEDPSHNRHMATFFENGVTPDIYPSGAVTEI